VTQEECLVVPSHRILGIELQRAIQCFLRFLVITFAGKRHAEMEICGFVFWIELYRFSKFTFGIGNFRFLRQQRSKLVVQLSFFWREKDGLLEFRDGVIRFMLQIEGARERLVSLPLPGSELHRDAKLSNSFVEAALGL
jgi:hypothetical protein